MANTRAITEDIIIKAQAGDIDAFSEIYKQYYNTVYFFAYHFLREQSLAQDITQEVFIRVYSKIHTLKEPKTLYTWIHKITYHECLNHTRKEKRFIDLGDAMDMDDFAEKTPLDPSKLYEDKWIRDTVVDSLENMSSPLKSVGILRFYSNLKVQEIADVLDIPEGTVNSRIHKIKKKLKVDLEKQGVSMRSLAITPIFIATAYEYLKSTAAYEVKTALMQTSLEKVIQTGTKTGISFALKMLITSSCVGVLCLGGFWMFNQQDEPIVKPEKAGEKSIQYASINKITYDTQWTNTEVELNIDISKGLYSKVLVNDIEQTTVTENGIYTVNLMYDDKLIDTKEVHIKNIDKESPNGTYELVNERYVIHLYDNLSQIDPSSIVLYRDGVVDYNFQYDGVSNILYVGESNSKFDEIFISDNAKNILRISIE